MPTAASGSGPAWINPAYAPAGSPAGLQEPANAYPGWKPGMPSLQQLNGGTTPIQPFQTTPGTGPAAPDNWTPPPMPDFMSPAMTQYVQQFQASQAKQQQAINAGLMQAMQGLGQRRDAAANLVASMPGQYNNIMNEANADLANSKGANAPMIGRNGGPAPVDAAGASNAQLIANSNKQIGIAGKEGTPLLQAGVTADYSKGATTLSNQKMQNDASLAQQAQAFAMQQAQAKAQAEQDWIKMQYGWHHDQQMQQQANQNNPDSLQNREAFMQWEADHGMLPKTNDPLSAAADQAAIGAGFQGGNKELQTTLGSQPYQFAVQVLSGQQGRGAKGIDSSMLSDSVPKAGDVNSVVKFYANQPDVLRALAVQGLLVYNKDTGQYQAGPAMGTK
jgi:hypothetical protein